MMRLYNATKKRVICDDCSKVNAVIGLMFQVPHPVIFSVKTPRIIALHNMFVFGTTDVIFLANDKVVEIKKNFYPFTFFTPKKKSTHVVELPTGMAKGISVNDQLLLR